MMDQKKYSAVKDKHERMYMVEDAARAFKRVAEVKREIAEIKAQPDLLKAVKAYLRQEIADTKKAIAT